MKCFHHQYRDAVVEVNHVGLCSECADKYTAKCVVCGYPCTTDTGGPTPCVEFVHHSCADAHIQGCELCRRFLDEFAKQFIGDVIDDVEGLDASH